jgi:hypothetical protein
MSVMQSSHQERWEEMRREWDVYCRNLERLKQQKRDEQERQPVAGRIYYGPKYASDCDGCGYEGEGFRRYDEDPAQVPVGEQCCELLECPKCGYGHFIR